MALDELVFRSRPADGDPAGVLVLMHGRGVDENDLFPLIDLLDPDRRLAAFTPRAPISPGPGAGNHWYIVHRVGFPHQESFGATYEVLGSWLASLEAETGIPPDRTLLGGFSQGGVMAYSMGLGPGRAVPAGIFALSSFVPVVEGWEPDFTGRAKLPVYHAHGTADPVIPVEFGRQARELLEGKVDLTYREHSGAHTIDPRSFAELSEWVRSAV